MTSYKWILVSLTVCIAGMLAGTFVGWKTRNLMVAFKSHADAIRQLDTRVRTLEGYISNLIVEAKKDVGVPSTGGKGNNGLDGEASENAELRGGDDQRSPS